MRENYPLVSIGLAVYNGGDKLRVALDSLIEQDYPNIELIISDNASTDNTQEICAEFMDKRRDNRIQYHRNRSNIGAIANFNRVFDLAQGEYFTWAAHDDYRYPEHISVCVDELEKSDKVVLAGTACDCVRADGSLLMVDRSLTTVGMTPKQRFMRYKRILHEYDSHRGGIFYGVFRTEVLRRIAPPLRSALTADQNMMLRLSLEGEFVTVRDVLLRRMMTGPSNSAGSLKGLARYYGIEGLAEVYGAYLWREKEIWKMVMGAGDGKLTRGEKMGLVLWSGMHTAVAVGKRVVQLGLGRTQK